MSINNISRYKNNIDTETNILGRGNIHKQRNVSRKFEIMKL